MVPGEFHCCQAHLELAGQPSDRPFRFSERDAYCASLLVFRSKGVPTGVPNLDHVGRLFDRLPCNAGDKFVVPDHLDRCAFLFFKEKPRSYEAILNERDEEIKWRGNGKQQVINHKGADLTSEGVTLRFKGVISEKLKSMQEGWWVFTHFLYRGHSLYCLTYERKRPRDAEDGYRGSDDQEEADGGDDDDKKDTKEAEKHPWIPKSIPKGARTTKTRSRDMSSFVGIGRKFNSNTPNLLASGTDDGISSVSWSRKVQQVSPSTSYDGTTGVIAIECKSSGADDGEICVWDLPKSSDPSHFLLLKGIGSATQGGNPWNRKVQQVSSTSYDGTTGVFAMECKSSGADDGEICVWDLPKSSDPSHFLLLKGLMQGIGSATQGGNAWNREVQQVSSSTSYDGTTGVFAMKWLPSRSSYLLTCVKDKHITFWSTNTSVVRRMKGLYGVEENRFGTAPLRAPRWYKHSVGFGGKLGASAKGASTIQSVVSLPSLVTEQSLVKRTSEFEEEESSGPALDDAIRDEVAEENDQAVDGLSANLNGTGLEDTAVHAAAETHEMQEEEESSGPTLDDAIQRALVLGDHKEVVVDQSTSANKMADALVGGRAVLVRNV